MLTTASEPRVQMAAEKSVKNAFYYKNSFILTDTLEGLWDLRGVRSMLLRTPMVQIASFFPFLKSHEGPPTALENPGLPLLYSKSSQLLQLEA